MKTYFSDIIPRIQKFSQKLNNLTLLTNQHWVVIEGINQSKTVYIFRQNNELLISKNGIVEKARWEYLGQNSLLIDRKEDSYLFKHGFFDENILALKIDSKNEYAFLVNESKFEEELNSLESIVEFLNQKYIEFGTNENVGKTEVKESTIHVSPSYKILNITEDRSFFGDVSDRLTIEFADNKRGEVFVKKMDRHFLK